MRFVLGSARCLKYELKLLMTWKFGAPLATMYTPEIEAKWGVEYHGGGGWYLDMPKSIIPYEEASFHK